MGYSTNGYPNKLPKGWGFHHANLAASEVSDENGAIRSASCGPKVYITTFRTKKSAINENINGWIFINIDVQEATGLSDFQISNNGIDNDS